MTSVWRACMNHWSMERAAGARLCDDSRLVTPGDIFVAYPGSRVDARLFIPEARARGAAGVILEPGWDVSALSGMRYQWLPDCRHQIAPLSYAWYGVPPDGMTLVAVTGTNGKTSFCYWMSQILKQLGARPAMIGTLGATAGDVWEDCALTTPTAPVLARWLRRFADESCTHVILEASSIGLVEGRLSGLHIDAAAYTNCTHDHLDYHGSMVAYAEAKSRLFAYPSLRGGAIFVGDALGQHLAQSLPRSSYCLYDLAPITEEAATGPMIWVSDARYMLSGTACVIHTETGAYPVAWPVLGDFNLKNVCAVLGTLRTLGYDWPDLLEAATMLQSPPGRMTRVQTGGVSDPVVYVDYAHTPDALLGVLRFLRRACSGRLSLVFGCGGERDREKRSVMGEIAANNSDSIWITNDNPRTESPSAIVSDILSGIPESTVYRVCFDRAEAIRQAIHAARPGDVVLIAGKGHECVQIMADGSYSFSDQAWAEQVLRQGVSDD